MRYNLEHVKLITAMREKKIDEAAEHLLEVLHEINENIESAKLHRTEILDDLKKVQKEIDYVRRGFPLEDPHGHRAYHEKMMREEEHHIKMKEQIVKEVIQKGVIIGITLVIGVLGLQFGFNFMGIVI